MIIDFAAINKLTPPGLLNLAVLERLIAHLLGVVEVNMHRTRKVLKLSRLIGRLAKQHRGNVNFNLRIRAWVLGSDSRRAQVRLVIGEVALRRWQLRYQALLGEIVPAPLFLPVPEFRQGKPVAAPKIRTRAYAWKSFALVNVAEASFQGYEVLDVKPIRPISININAWTQPREPRVLKPAEFWPHELEPEYIARAQDLCITKTLKQTCALAETSPEFETTDLLEKPPPDNVQAGKAKPP